MNNLSSQGSPARWQQLLRPFAFSLATLGLLGMASTTQAQAPTFASAATYSTGSGSGPFSVAAADVNGDGRRDIVTANYYTNTVGVLLGQAGGGFAPVTSYSVGSGSGPLSVAVADVNGDSRPDIVASNYDSSNVGVLLGLSGGGFGTATNYSTGSSSAPREVVVADVNGDNRADIVTANANTGVGVLLGLSSGGFAAVTTYSTGSFGSTSVAVANVNGDSFPDLVAASPLGDLAVLLGQSGGFQAAVTYSVNNNGPLGGGIDDMAVADVNGDTFPDIVAASDGSVLLLPGQSGGSFGSAITNAGIYANKLVLADINGDGFLDVVAANGSGSNTIGVLLGQNGGFATTGVTYPAGGSPNDLTVADINSDGQLDIVTANANDNQAAVLLNTRVAISSLSAPSGAAGTSITLTGANFTGATAVAFNGTAATSFTVNSATSITATVPAGAGTGPVTVTTPGGTATGPSFTVSFPDLVISTPGQTIAAGTYNSITINSGGVATLGGNVTVNSSVLINDGGQLNSVANFVSGAATFTLAAGGTLSIGSPVGLSNNTATGSVQTTGTRSFSDDANYVYNYAGSANTAAGNALPATVRSLELNLISPSRTFTLAQALQVRQRLILTNGRLSTVTREVTLLSDANGTALIVNTSGTVLGNNGRMQRYIGTNTGASGYRHYASPMQSETVNTLATTGYTPDFSGAATYNTSATPNLVTPFPTVFRYS